MNAIKDEPIKLYTLPNCGKCDMTKIGLDRRGIEYTPIDLSQDADALEYVQSLGYKGAPVVDAGNGNHWNDFRPDKIANLIPSRTPPAPAWESEPRGIDFSTFDPRRIEELGPIPPPPAM